MFDSINQLVQCSFLIDVGAGWWEAVGYDGEGWLESLQCLQGGGGWHGQDIKEQVQSLWLHYGLKSYNLCS